jgi:tetratricopeptide (TPR) repeat protein
LTIHNLFVGLRPEAPKSKRRSTIARARVQERVDDKPRDLVAATLRQEQVWEKAMKIRIFALAAAAAAMIGSANAQQAADDHLGTVHFSISCSVVQAKFDRGVALLHNFFYPETVKAFQAIIQEDPSCAIAYWGLAMSELPNPLVPPFPPANLKAGWEAIQQGKAAKTQTPREAEYLAAIEVFYKDYDKTDQKTRAELYEQAMQRLHEHHPEDAEAAIFYALAINGAVDFDDKNFTKQLKAAAILKEASKKQPDHPGIAHYMIHSYDFAPLAAMCVQTAQLYDKIAPGAPHALHMPSHIYSILGTWDDSIRSNLASKAAADDYAAKNFPDATHQSVPHLLDFLVYAYLQTGKDSDATQLVDSLPKLKKFPVTGLAIDTALAAIPARFALDRGRWDEAAQLPVRDSQFPAAQSISYFARALGAARSGNPVAAGAEIAHLEEMEAKLAAAKNGYWAEQTRIQKEAAAAWVLFAGGQRDAAIAAMRKAADLDDASEKNVAMENKLVPIRTLLGELYLASGMNKEALAEFEASQKVMPSRFRTIAGAAAATRATGSVEAAKRYYRALTGLAVGGDGNRPEVSEAISYLAQN